MAKSTKIWDGTNWHDLQGPPGPNAVSTDVGNDLKLGSDGLLYIETLNAMSSDSYIFCAPQYDLAAKYQEAKALRPRGQPLSANNRALLIVWPAVHQLPNGRLAIDADFVDILCLGAIPLYRGCLPAVTVSGGVVDVTASDVRITGVGAFAFNTADNKPNHYFYMCSSQLGGFGLLAASGTYVNCQTGFGGGFGVAAASGTFVNCDAGLAGAFGAGLGSTSSGKFYNCSGGASSFGGDGGVASGTYLNCQLGLGPFPTLAAGGRRRFCLDGTLTINNDGV